MDSISVVTGKSVSSFSGDVVLGPMCSIAKPETKADDSEMIRPQPDPAAPSLPTNSSRKLTTAAPSEPLFQRHKPLLDEWEKLKALPVLPPSPKDSSYTK